MLFFEHMYTIYSSSPLCTQSAALMGAASEHRKVARSSLEVDRSKTGIPSAEHTELMSAQGMIYTSNLPNTFLTFPTHFVYTHCSVAGAPASVHVWMLLSYLELDGIHGVWEY